MTLRQAFSYFVIAMIFLSCSEDKNGKDIFEKEVSRFSYLDKSFREINYDTFYVYSSDNVEDPNYQFHGKKMDSIQVSFLPVAMREEYKFNKDFAACYKFKIDRKITGLISRVPGEYVSSAIKLFLFDESKDSVVTDFYLADNFGDAGEVYAYRSCIFKDKNKRHLILTYITTSYDHSVENNGADTLVERWNKYVLFDLAKNKVDTLSSDSAFITKLHPEIVTKLTGD
jgi:hypothetical protein